MTTTVMLSGHCATPSTSDPESSHQRCARMGGGNRHRRDKTFLPCPCRCHFPEDEYECECGGTLVEAPHWPNVNDKGHEIFQPGDPNWEMVYVHINPRTNLITGEDCP